MLDLNKIIVDLQTNTLSESELFEMYDAGYLNNDEMNYIDMTLGYIYEEDSIDSKFHGNSVDTKYKNLPTMNMILNPKNEPRMPQEKYEAFKRAASKTQDPRKEKLARKFLSDQNFLDKVRKAKEIQINQKYEDLKNKYGLSGNESSIEAGDIINKKLSNNDKVLVNHNIDKYQKEAPFYRIR